LVFADYYYSQSRVQRNRAMSCTSKKKTEFCGLPLLPGSKAWEKHEEKRREERRRIVEATPIIDDAAPKADLRREINLHEMRNAVGTQTKREVENRRMLNTISFTWQNPSGVDSVNTTKKVESTRRQCVANQLKTRMKDNVSLATKIHAVQSDYDYIDMAIDWKLTEQKRESRLRYNPKDWAPVFERNRQRQQTRGRSLDPNYKFLF